MLKSNQITGLNLQTLVVVERGGGAGTSSGGVSVWSIMIFKSQRTVRTHEMCVLQSS